ncbi:transmembrane protein, putative (macronuclear) [Tetrahymena thermophila SB210]|uniref:Transmembrane protein, putative n=1 Tax=Tetrahymena thermophila (strain SB210) TaxID=312017 RepID=W7X803_TETTS|nr:transmembrane protein, putative [Tetrahymena thermophila SB210]EWS75505.1 transmembrane protein, putative [Tetrahymena thermophila SB210]|eukprot:XP_012651974.1 transmembrane protein, putative [Tetrahymena thermophila SB210]
MSLSVDFAVNIQQQIELQNLIQILLQKEYPRNCKYILLDGNYDQNLETSHPFPINQIYNKYFLITLQQEISLNGLQSSLLKETSIQYFENKKKQISQNQASLIQINKNNSLILKNILSNKNYKKQFQIFLISFQENKKQDVNLSYTCKLFQNIHLFQGKKNVKVRNNTYLKFNQESKRKFNTDFEQQLIFGYVNSKLSGKFIKNLDFNFSFFNFKMEKMTVESLKSKIQKYQFLSLKILFRDSLFDYKTLINFLKCFKLFTFGKIYLDFQNIEFKSIKGIQAILDFLYSNKILFQISIQKSKLMNQKDNLLVIQYGNNYYIPLKFLKEDGCLLNLIIDQSSNNSLIIKLLNGLHPELWNFIQMKLENQEDIDFFLKQSKKNQVVLNAFFLFIIFISEFINQRLLINNIRRLYNQLQQWIIINFVFLNFEIFTNFIDDFKQIQLNLQYCQIILSLLSFLLVNYNKQRCKFIVIVEAQKNRKQAEKYRKTSKRLLIIPLLINIIVIIFNLYLIITDRLQVDQQSIIVSFYFIGQLVIFETINIYKNFNELTNNYGG